MNISTDATGLGKALLPRPDFIPEQSLDNKLIDSGVALIRYEDYSFYFVSESRVRSLATAFLRGEKQMVSKPDIAFSELMLEVTFLLYGEKITMNVYPDYIHIEDAGDSMWYAVNEDVSGQIRATISAN